MADLLLESVSLWPKSERAMPGREPHPIANDVSFSVPEGESVALIGESGAGKTSLALAIMGLWPGSIEGNISLGAQRLSELPAAVYRGLRGRQLVMMLQDPMAALNPVLTIGWQVREILRRRRGLDAREARISACEWLERVGLGPAKKSARLYPHQLSGGMAQRVLLAMALTCRPEVLIADEPFSALDPALMLEQAQLLSDVRAELGFSLLLITHNLSLAAALSSSVVVLRNGRVVETGSTSAVFERPHDGYTAELVEASGVKVGARWDR